MAVPQIPNLYMAIFWPKKTFDHFLSKGREVRRNFQTVHLSVGQKCQQNQKWQDWNKKNDPNNDI